MTHDHYDFIIGTEQHYLLVLCYENKAPVFTRSQFGYEGAGMAMYSADAVPSGTGSLSSINP